MVYFRCFRCKQYYSDGDGGRIARWARFGLLATLLLLVTDSLHADPRRAPSPAPLSARAEAARHALPARVAPFLADALAADQTADYGIAPSTERENDFRAANRAQHLTAAFQPDGVSFASDDATATTVRARLRLRAVGDDAALMPVTDAPPILSGTHVEYQRGR